MEETNFQLLHAIYVALALVTSMIVSAVSGLVWKDESWWEGTRRTFFGGSLMFALYVLVRSLW